MRCLARTGHKALLELAIDASLKPATLPYGVHSGHDGIQIVLHVGVPSYDYNVTSSEM